MFKIHERLTHFQSGSSGSSCNSTLTYPIEVIIIVVCCLLGIAWAIYNIFQVEKIKVRGGFTGDSSVKPMSPRQEELLLELGDKISEVDNVLFRAPKSFSDQSTQFASSSLLSCSSSSLSLPSRESGPPSHSSSEQLSPSSAVSSGW